MEDRFEITSRLGSGSFGIVYEAFDRYRNRTVALKMLERAVPDAVARFKREFRYLAELRHPNLASLYELLVLGDKWALSMELIRGTELLEHLAIAEMQNSLLESRKESTQPLLNGDQTLRFRKKKRTAGISSLYFDAVRDAFGQLALAIAVLHQQGVVHRDIKPSNIMITAEGRVVLLDFGLVVEIARDDSLDRKTVVGTPGYMAPEQIRASTPTAAGDWYGFGVLLYQALTGQMPFTAPTPLEMMELQIHSNAPSAAGRLPGAPADLTSLADDCIRRDPLDRPYDSEILRRFGFAKADLGRPERKRPRLTQLIGRSRDVKTLLSWIADGDSSVICLYGWAGTGKSALLDEVLDRVRAEQNAFIVGGACQAWESVPFNAVDVIVDSLARELRHQRPPAVDDVMRKAVAVTQLFPVLPVPTGDAGDETVLLPATGEKLITRAAAELRSILLATAGERPLVLIVDNAQWGDYQSAKVLLRLLDARMRLILCCQSEDRRTSLLLQTLTSSGVVIREFHLKELTRSTTAALVKRATGRAGARLIDRIYRATGGNPALIEIAIESLGSKSANDPALLAYALASRLQHLSAAAHRLFTWLLSADGTAREEVAAEVLELFEIDEPLRTLRRERLIRVRRTGDLRGIDIYHPKIREAFFVAA
jgi:eukaryotic-like serine/threonine-protein kinase